MSPRTLRTITTNGKLDSAKAQGVIAEGGVDLAIEEPLGNAPRWMKLVWQKVTKRQKLASMKQKKKKESAWESAIPIENVQRQRKKEEPQWITMTNDKKARRTSGDFVSRGPDRRHNQQSFEGGR